MQYAVVGGQRLEPFRGGRGKCPICGSVMIAKCGPRILHHWSHFGRRNCDAWWESETIWHRDWKSQFPANWAEVRHQAPDGEIHRADIKTPKGIVVEIQHSPMSDAERISREQFYKNMVWVIDGRDFKRNFDIYHMLPSPNSKLADDIVWIKASRPMQGAARGIFFKLTEALECTPEANKKTLNSGIMHFFNEIERDVKLKFRGHHQYDWVRPRRTWLNSSCPVFIDFGWDCLVKLSLYDEYALPCVVLVSKFQFIHDAMTVSHASEICGVLDDLWTIGRH